MYYMEHPHIPSEERIEGPLEIHFTNKGSVHTAGSKFTSDPERKVVQVPSNAEVIFRNKRILEVKLEGTNVHWTTDVIRHVIKNGERIL